MSYANKKKREELSDLSKKVFGTRSKWQYFTRERGYSIESIEEQMLMLVKAIDEQLKESQNDQIKPRPTKTRRPNRATRRKFKLDGHKTR